MYKTFITHAKKLIKNAEEVKPDKPEIRGIKHYEDGSLAVTDSHRLYLAKDIHDKGECLLTPTLGRVEGNYPEVKRMIPDAGHAELDPITFDLKEVLKGVDVISTAASLRSETEDPVMSWKENTIKCNTLEVKASYELTISLETDISMNVFYMLEALKLFKAFKHTEAVFTFHGKFRPFTITSKDDKLMALILPVRRY